MKVKTETIIRTILLLVALLNQTLTMLGKNPLPFSDESIYTGLTAVATIGATVWAWWKNNSFTAEAIISDEHMKSMKAGGTQEEDEI